MAVVDPATEELYMPSRWVKRVRSEEVCTLHVQVTSELSRKSRNMPQARLGVSTGPDSSDVVDIFNEAGISSSIVVYVSGGYWLDLSGDISAYTVQPLVAHGHTVVVVHYDRAPTQTFTQIMQQVNRSIEWIVEYAQRTKKKIWLSDEGTIAASCLETQQLLYKYVED
ncbi:kynurenine formamidase [Eurytemora carolleeae]|uniref:kynurenine formamidase n=1 Tax=Eurytemora carolleeae TaxID=1294199 RepID=UPI000C7947C1|nr:kynurenine formamidase [Eurytemora carolleeae]|eukprot:XP_023333852.1 kynurenine formamidase-like [Eurytemora affinis]